MAEPTIDELADQVRQGLAEDERIARLAGAGNWHVECDYTPGGCPPGCECRHRRIEGDGTPGITIYDEGGHDEDQADHITRHDPRRVLADVASRQALLDLALGWEHHFSGNHYECCPGFLREPDDDRPCRCGRDERVLAVLEHLAQPYQETTC